MTVTTETTPVGVPVIVKLLLAAVEDFDSVKKFVADPSGAAFTSIVTPCGGAQISKPRSSRGEEALSEKAEAL